MLSGFQVARLQGLGVLVGVFTGVLVGIGVKVAVGVKVFVGTKGMVAVGDASNATRVNSAATVCAACVKIASGASGVFILPLKLKGRLHAAASNPGNTRAIRFFFIRPLLIYDGFILLVDVIN
jgi:hypothetical protein